MGKNRAEPSANQSDGFHGEEPSGGVKGNDAEARLSPGPLAAGVDRADALKGWAFNHIRHYLKCLGGSRTHLIKQPLTRILGS